MCTLYGAFPGQEVVTGRNYVDIGYGLNVSDIWRRNFLVLLGFLILFQITQLVLIEYFPHFDGGSSITIYAPEDADTKKRNAILRERKERRTGKSVSEKAEIEKEEQGGCVRSCIRFGSSSDKRCTESRPSSTASHSPGSRSTTTSLSLAALAGCCTTCMVTSNPAL